MISINKPLFETKAVSKATDQLMSTQTEQTITSLEVAELTDKNHKEVLRDIRNILSQLEDGPERNFALGSYKDTQNQERPMFNLTKEGCLCLVSGYDAKSQDENHQSLEGIGTTSPASSSQDFW